MQADLIPVSFDDLPDWSRDDPRQVLAGLLDCADYARTVKPYKTGSLGLQWSDLETALQRLRERSISNAADARSFFEQNFTPFKVSPSDGSEGFVTAYYEPEVEVARERSESYCFPFHRRPDDLVALTAENRPEALDPEFAYGRTTPEGICEYPDRATIENGFLDGRGLEIAWAKNRIDVFFAHIQGAARLRYPDGSLERITYAAKTGHPFTAIGRVLIAMGEQDPVTISMQSLRAWLAENPERVDEILWKNRSYIFFRTAPVADPKRGPVAAAKVPLIAGRSLAVDKRIHTFGTPVFVQADDLVHWTEGPFRRLMIAQDTGSAIVGPARGDIFAGSGATAGEQAGTVKDKAAFFALVPNQAAGRVRP